MIQIWNALCKKSSHSALNGWLAQRLTAALMTLFTLVVLLQLILRKGSLGYDRWASIFDNQPMKVLTFVTILALAWHVWLGMQEIYRDYIKPLWLRLTLKFLTAIWLVGCGGWAIQVIWRV